MANRIPFEARPRTRGSARKLFNLFCFPQHDPELMDRLTFQVTNSLLSHGELFGYFGLGQILPISIVEYPAIFSRTLSWKRSVSWTM